MKQRTAIHIILSFAVAVMLIICGTAFQTRYSSDPQEWLAAHRQTPLLWLVDFTALYTLVLMGTLARARKRLYRQAEEMYVLREEHNNQLGAIIARASEVEEINEQQAERLEQLEAEARSRQEAFEEEARRLIEQMFRSLQGQVETHSRQLDAVNLALQYHRAELAELRHQVRGDADSRDVEPASRLTPAELTAITSGFQTQETEEPLAPALSDDRAQTARSEAEETPKTLSSLAVVETPETAPSPTDKSEETPVGQRGARSHSPQTPRNLEESDIAVFDPTINARSTLVLDTAEFDAFSVPPTPPDFKSSSKG